MIVRLGNARPEADRLWAECSLSIHLLTLEARPGCGISMATRVLVRALLRRWSWRFLDVPLGSAPAEDSDVVEWLLGHFELRAKPA